MASSTLVVGLGNPGPEYALTRHNVGFWAIDRLAGALRIRVDAPAGHSLVGRGQIRGWRVILAKPQIFMNLSGKAVRALLKSEGLGPEDLILMHDDMDIALGRVKLNTTGGDAGHNGVSSVLEHLATGDFRRLRIGLGRPPHNVEGADWVLSPFEESEREAAEAAAGEAADRVAELIRTRR
ncbi:MAG: aminoacyl-tRNA hydrolase [bacterium]